MGWWRSVLEVVEGSGKRRERGTHSVAEESVDEGEPSLDVLATSRRLVRDGEGGDDAAALGSDGV